ncbi:hypothetical protein AVEN_154838-1 [Araneus ventricosus]|uniref:Uncharacterized protein n=1 Tax=Araneus ventricosus TaxID=182803 RepID=A0A4Y2BTB6_ARAVE|nr:hypothetical protein AVEN_154838-1 [Araneus ventricosus]
MRSGDLLVEVASRQQAIQIRKLQALSTLSVSVKSHETLKTSKGAITCGRLLNLPIEEITQELSGQGVKDVRRINIRRDGELVPTKHFILTFNTTINVRPCDCVCDTTSALFGQGKNKLISLFWKHEELLNTAATFINPQATTEQVTEAGGNVLVTLYGGDPATQNLDELRYHSFVKATAKTKFNLARLPPTTDAAQLHAMRSYHQLQRWLGNEKDPLKWG